MLSMVEATSGPRESPCRGPGCDTIGPTPTQVFLRQALGSNMNDSRLPATLLTVALVLAVGWRSWTRLRARRNAAAGSEDADLRGREPRPKP